MEVETQSDDYHRGYLDAIKFYGDVTIRDQFAMAALQGGLSGNWTGSVKGEPFETSMAISCYVFADAMLAQRDKGE